MAYTVQQLIANAYYTSEIVAREFQQVGAYQFNDGLILLNEIISDKTIEEDMIPTYTIQYPFNGVIGQEMYFIPGLTRADTLTFYIDTVRYCTREMARNAYFGNARANQIKSLPFNWNQERTLGGTNLFIYFTPDQNYPMQITGLFAMQQVVNNQDLTLILDPFYISYLKYRLADKLCTFFNFELPPGARSELLRYEQMISKRSGPLDMSVRTISTLNRPASVNYGQVNLGHGWTV